jgi:hypothetical protein
MDFVYMQIMKVHLRLFVILMDLSFKVWYLSLKGRNLKIHFPDKNEDQ